MNKNRRSQLDKAHSLILEAQEIVASVRDEEQEARDNLPENLQYSERAETIEEYISTLDDTESTLDDILSNLTEIIEG